MVLGIEPEARVEKGTEDEAVYAHSGFILIHSNVKLKQG